MNRKILQLEAKRLRSARANVEAAEIITKAALNAFLEYGTAKAAAAEFGVSEQFLCDVRKGRRRISDELLDQLCGGKLRHQGAQ